MGKTGPKNISVANRLERYYVPEPNSGCWLWFGYTNEAGYGTIGNESGKKPTKLLAHRAAYEIFKGPIPEGLQLDHLCRMRCCINPDHLEPVTGKENVHRSPIWNGNLTNCPSGHPYFGTNLMLYKGSKRCKECHKLLERNRRKIKREAKHVFPV